MVCDVSAWQGGTQAELNAFAERLYKDGVRGLIIKLTQGYVGLHPYENSYAAAQYRAWNKIMTEHGHTNPNVGFYNYAIGLNGANNAKYFLAWLRAFGMDKNTVVMLDFEDPTVGSNYEVNQWLKIMKDAGFKNRGVYSMAGWFGDKISPVAIQTNNFWVAAYASTPPALVRNNYYHTAWQYTSTFKGLSLDMNLDYDHILAPNTPKKISKPKKNDHKVAKPKNAKPAKKANKKAATGSVKKQSKPENSKPKVQVKKSEYAKHAGMFTNRLGLNEFSDPELKNKVGVLPARSVFKALPVSDGNVTRLMLDPYGIFVSGNLSWVSKAK